MPTTRITINGVPPYDGAYDVDMNFTNRDWHTIKQIAGVTAGEFQDAVLRKDLDLVIAIAVNTLRRTGRPVDLDALWDSEAGRIILEDVETEEDAVPPPQPSGHSNGKPLEQTTSSGASGNGTGDYHPVSSPSATGIPV